MKIKIGPYRYKLVEDPDLLKGGNTAGQLLPTPQKILIPVVGPGIDRQFVNVCIMHECVHGMLDVIGELDLNGNEHFVERMSFAMLALIQDNPKLIDRLYEV